MSEFGDLPDTLVVLPVAGSQTEAEMRKIAMAYNNSRDPMIRNAYFKKYEGLAEENRWD